MNAAITLTKMANTIKALTAWRIPEKENKQDSKKTQDSRGPLSQCFLFDFYLVLLNVD